MNSVGYPTEMTVFISEFQNIVMQREPVIAQSQLGIKKRMTLDSI